MGKTSTLAEFKERIARWIENKTVGFRVHATVFTAVNAFLFFINMVTSSGFPWFYFPLGGWGIGLVADFVTLHNQRYRVRQLAKINDCNDEQLGLVKNLLNTITSFREHAAVYAATIGFLFGINMLTSSGFLWFLFPAGGWGIGLVSHWAAAGARKKLLLDRLKRLGIDWRNLKSVFFTYHTQAGLNASGHQPANEDQQLLQQALEIKDFLMHQGEVNKEFKEQFKQEVQPLLEKFLKQITELVSVKTEVTEALGVVSENDLLEQIRQLKAKQAQSANSLLQKEYDKSLKQYEHHRQSVEDLKSHKELIELRLNSSLTALKQLKLDVARLKTVSSIEEPYSLKELKTKSQELSDYLADLRDSYKELDQK